MFRQLSIKNNVIFKDRRLETASFILLVILFSFPVIDYLLRDILAVPVLSSLWDELILAAGILLSVVHYIKTKDSRPASSLNNAILIFFLFGISLIIIDLSTLQINLEGFRAVYQYILFFYVGFYLFRDYRQTRYLMIIAVTLGALIGLYGIYQYIVGAPMPGRWVDSAESIRTRAFSIVGSPNVLGSHMALLAPIGLGLLLSEPKRWLKLIWLASIGVFVLCLLFTLSRGAWLAFAGALAIMGIFYDRRILIAGLIAAMLTVMFVPAVNQRMTYMFSTEYLEKSSQSGRIDRWLKAYDQMRMDPLLGVGLGHFGGAVAKRNFNSISVDNYYAGIMAEMGLLGIGLFLFLILLTLKHCFRSWKSLREPPHRFLAASMLAGLLAIALHNSVENVFEVPYLSTYFWAMAGLLVAFGYSSYGGADDEQS